MFSLRVWYTFKHSSTSSITCNSMYCVQTSLKMKRSRILSVALSNIPTRTAIMVFALSVGHIDNTRGADTIRNFKVKLDNKHLRTGIFVAPNGIAAATGIFKSMARMVRLICLQVGTKIVVLEDEDIRAILNCTDITEQVNKRFLDLYKM